MKKITINGVLIEYMHFDGQDWRSVVDAFDIKYFRVEKHYRKNGPDTDFILDIGNISGGLEKGTTLLRWGDNMMIMDTDFFNKVIVEPNQK